MKASEARELAESSRMKMMEWLIPRIHTAIHDRAKSGYKYVHYTLPDQLEVEDVVAYLKEDGYTVISSVNGGIHIHW